MHGRWAEATSLALAVGASGAFAQDARGPHAAAANAAFAEARALEAKGQNVEAVHSYTRAGLNGHCGAARRLADVWTKGQLGITPDYFHHGRFWIDRAYDLCTTPEEKARRRAQEEALLLQNDCPKETACRSSR